MMSDIERSQGLAYFGYTPRQAHFLTLVALHGGYFLRRQYVQFTGGGHGLAAVRFLAKAAAHDHIRQLPYGRHGAMFHLCARPVYAALGQEHNRNRRPAEWIAVVRKLMTLDFVLTKPAVQFWATEEDKTALLRELNVDQQTWPAKRYQPRHDGKAVDDTPFRRQDAVVSRAGRSSRVVRVRQRGEHAGRLRHVPPRVRGRARVDAVRRVIRRCESMSRPSGTVVCAEAPSRA